MEKSPLFASDQKDGGSGDGRILRGKNREGNHEEKEDHPNRTNEGRVVKEERQGNGGGEEKNGEKEERRRMEIKRRGEEWK